MRCTANWAGTCALSFWPRNSKLIDGSLEFVPADENIPRVIALSDHAKEATALQPTLGQTMDAFMSYLLFWQDTIDHCKSAEVNDTLLDHFQVLFLEQLL